MNKQLEKYVKVYNRILFQSRKNDLISSKLMISKPLTSDDLYKMLQTMDVIYTQKDDIQILYDPDNLINESKNYSDILVNILNANDKVYNESLILSLTNKKWKYFKQFSKSVKPFYLKKFNFSNSDEIKNMYFSFFMLDDDQLNNQIQIFKNSSEHSNAVYMHSDDLKIMCLNTAKNITIQTIIHEFTHYLQDVLNYDVIKFRKSFTFDERKIQFLNLTNQQLNILFDEFNQQQIMPRINEFIFIMKKVYDEYCKNLKLQPQVFIDFTLKFLLSEKIYQSEIYQNYLKFSNDELPLLTFICCMIFNMNKNKILKRFKDQLR